MVDYVIDATDCIVGRIATVAAREALHNKNVVIVNVEKAVFSGKKAMVVAIWKRKFTMGAPSKGPFVRRQPDRLLRRVIKGMLPDTVRGREALKRVMCYIGQPETIKDAQVIEGANYEKLPNSRVVTLATLCNELGGKWNE